MTTKKCTKCGQEKELCCFGHTKRTLDNYEYQCKDCRKLWHVTYLANAKKDTPITHLVCSKCKIQKPVIMFQKNSGTKSGYCVYCKDCRRTKSKEVTPDGKLHCPKCDETKPAEQFHKNKNRKHRL